MLLSNRIFTYVAPTALILCLVVRSAAVQPLILGPALSANPVESGPASPPLTDKRTQNAEQLRLAQLKLNATGNSDKTAAQEVAFYQTRNAVLAQQEAVAQQIKDATARKEKLQAQLKDPPAADKEMKFADLDQLRDDLASDEARSALLADKLETANDNKDRAQAAVDDYSAKNRQAQAAYEKGKAGANAAALGAAAEQAQHDAELATEVLALRISEVAREELAIDIQKLNQQLHQNQVARLTPLVKFTKQDYEALVDEIKTKQDAATNAMTQATANLRNAEFELNETKKKLDAVTGAERDELAEQAAAQYRIKQKYTEEFDSWSQRLQQLNQLKMAWDRRYELAASKLDPNDQDTYVKLKTERKETQRELDELASALRIQILTMKDLRNQLSKVSQKVSAKANASAEALSWIRVQQGALEETLRIYDEKLVRVENARRVHEKLLDELNSSLQGMTPKTIALGAWYQIKAIWDYTFHIGGKAITVGMAIQGLATLVLGWMFARFASVLVAFRVLKRFHLSKDATSAIRSLVYYSMLSVVVLESMKIVNIDLTALTILGGALAIGVGFGSQALINNFIGGLIMLAERPVRLGERINFGGMDGIVEEVGFRCTKLRTNTDHLLTIPNSTLVNEKIENVDRRRTIRRKLTLPVTYNITREMLGVAVQAVRDILEEKEIRERIHPIIGFEEFRPRVHFSEFGTESLVIQIVYWYERVNDWWSYIEHTERVNFRILEEFERLGIEFAFPSKTSYVRKLSKPTAIGREPGSFAA